MADVKVERKQSLQREQAAERLSTLAGALAKGGDVELVLDDVTISVHVPDDVHAEFELEVDGDEVELELELKWSTRHAHTAAKRK